MAVAIALTPRPADASVVVAITGAGATVTVYRTREDGEREILRGSPFPTQAGAVTVVDHEAPFGLLRYATTDTGADAVSTTLDVSRPWLTNPVSGSYLSIPVTITDDTDWTLEARAFPFDVIDRADPVVTFYRRASRAGLLTLRYSSAGELSNVADVLEDGTPLLLRTPRGCPFPTGYRAIELVRIRPDRPGSSTGEIDMDYRTCAAPAGAPAGGAWSWADVPPAYPTWSALRAGLPTWSAVVAHDPGGATTFAAFGA